METEQYIIEMKKIHGLSDYFTDMASKIMSDTSPRLGSPEMDVAGRLTAAEVLINLAAKVR